MQPIIKIIYYDEPGQCDQAFGKIADFLGIDSVFLPIDEYITGISSSESSENAGILALGCNTLARIYEDKNSCENLITSIKSNTSYLYVYGISPGNANTDAVRALSGGIVKDIIGYSNGEDRYEVSTDNSDITKHFTGLSISGVNRETDFGLEVSDLNNGATRLITINSRPLFLKIDESPGTIFLQATNEILDIDLPAVGITHTYSYFSRLIPPVMFFKYVFKDRCWHSEGEFASVIIDDPPLKKNYGFLNYDSLLDEMECHDFFTNIAFIPWNYRRTDKNIAEMFKKRSDRLAISIHGCEHTRGELGITDPREMDRIAKLALQRMELHEKSYGIPFDKVMIFPQGIFSTEAMKVLKSNNYLASFNSGFKTAEQSIDVKIRDVLEPAIMNYFGFPLYTRRDPSEIASYAFDLFFGKPALIGTHHHDYKNTKTITDLVDGLNTLSSGLKWISLGDIAKTTYSERRLGKDEHQIRLYSPAATIYSRSDHAARYHFLKKESPEIRIKQVNIDGNETPYKLEGNDLCFDAEIPPGGGINVEIAYEELYTDTRTCQGTLKRIQVAARRMASEIRDNYVDKQPILTAIYKKIRKPN